MTPANPQAQDSPPSSARDDVAELIERIGSLSKGLAAETAAAIAAQQAEIARLGGIYESAVKGRQDFRAAFRQQRDANVRLRDILSKADKAINPPDRSGISMHEWNGRLKQATAAIRAALTEPKP